MNKVGELHAFTDALRSALAAASLSKNVGEFLKRIPLNVFTSERCLPYDFIHEGMILMNLFDENTSGRDFEHGKSHSMIFLTAPQEPGFPTEHCSWSRTPSPGCRWVGWPRWEWRG